MYNAVAESSGHTKTSYSKLAYFANSATELPSILPNYGPAITALKPGKL
jgi:hypothetical protein